MPPTFADVKDAIGAALAPFFSSDIDDAPALDVAELTEPDDELHGVLLAEGAKPKMVVGRLKGQTTTTVQTLVFPKSAFPSVEDCKAWLGRNGLTAGKVDETDDSYRYRQRDPGDFEPGTFRTIVPGEKKATEPVPDPPEPEPVPVILAESPSSEFLSEYRRLILSLSKDRDLSEDDLLQIYRKARGHAGGSAAAAKRREMQATELQLNEFTWGVELGEVGTPIQIMRTGEFTHPEYGKFAITPQDLAEIKANFDAQVRGQDIPIDVDHDHEGGAVGWMKSLAVKDDTLWATPEWTDQGAQDVAAGRYRYFSPHFGPWKDPESGEKHRVVLMSGAITNFPFLKGMEPISLSEFATRKEGRTVAEETQTQQAETEVKLSEAEAARVEAERKLTEKDTEVKALTERIQKMERDGMVKRLTERIRGNGNPNHRIIGDEEKKIGLVVKLAETFGEESDEVTAYLEDQESVSTALREAGAFRETGSTREGKAGDAQVTFEAKLAEVMAANPTLNRGQAATKILSENPKLYQQYNAAMPTGSPRN